MYNGLLKLKKIGTSIGIILSKDIREFINVYENEFIGVQLWKITNHTCPHCEDEFKKLKGGKEIKMSEENKVEDETKVETEAETKPEEEKQVEDEENSDDDEEKDE